jgi:membrane protein DedA with SNARE-associated domain
MNKTTLLKVLGYITIGLVLLITIRYIKMFPAILKLLALAANVVTVYYAYNYFIKNKKTKKNDN